MSQLNTQIVNVLRMADVKERFNELGAEPYGSKQEEFETFIKTEMERRAKVIKARGIHLD